MSYKLFLDDMRVPSDVTWVSLPTLNRKDWVIVRNYDDFVSCIESRGLPSFITFDHDLADEHYHTGDQSTYVEKTGYDCAKWLVDYCMTHNYEIPKFQVHSLNPVGAKNISMYITNAKRHM